MYLSASPWRTCHLSNRHIDYDGFKRIAINVFLENVFSALKGTTKRHSLAHLYTYFEIVESDAIKRPGDFLLSDVAAPQLYLLIALLD